jgi:hypothetical protein
MRSARFLAALIAFVSKITKKAAPGTKGGLSNFGARPFARPGELKQQPLSMETADVI